MKKKAKQVIVSVINDLATDQRVHKVCKSLQNAGYEVLLVGRKFRKSPAVSRSYKTYRMRLIFNKTFLFYLEYNIRLFFFLLFSKTDILLSNDTDTLIANYLTSKIKHKPLVFDAHEMFPEVPEVVERKFVKRCWSSIEDWIFPKLKYCYTVCQSIADIYNKKYGIEMKVVRNIPLSQITNNDSKEILIPTKNKLFPEHNERHILLYQGAVNVGRGIEWIIDSMPYLDKYVFYIAGDGDRMKDIQEKVKKTGTEDRVKFLGRIPFEQLSYYTNYADIGISLLENMGLNYYYSLPNRIFDFIQKNVPILATDFPEIRKIISRYDIGKLVVDYDPVHLASSIQELTAKGKNWDGFAQARSELSWEKESDVLLKIFSEL